MRKNFGAKPMIYPMPVLIIGTFDENGIPDAMNAAWGGISEEKEISICISEGHKTTKNILFQKCFTVSIPTVEQTVAADYVGIASGNDTPDKIEKAGWTYVKSEIINAPVFNELPFTLECKLTSYDSDSCRLVGEILNVSADENILTDGKVDLQKFRPITFDPANHDYVALGEKAGKAFSDGKKLK
ncbi:MAG: flavin reductase family protein [Ruminococcaceae bacterium]|nr:flavin reductase family protein [Oscillospiraceae bacterium]MBR3595449.1 flavin reductase family protein [Clostridia bacterium]